MVSFLTQAASIEACQAHVDAQWIILARSEMTALSAEDMTLYATWLSKHCVHSSLCTDWDSFGGWSLAMPLM